MDYSDTTIVIPSKNEPAIEKVTKEILKELPSCKVIIVYMGSKPKISSNRVALILQKGKGYGNAILQGFSASKSSITGMMDADGTYDPKDLKKVVSLVREGADLAIGSRLASRRKDSMPFYIILGNTILTLAYRVLYFKNIGDSQSGLRAMSGKFLDSVKLNEKGMSLPTEMNGKAARYGFRIAHVPINYYVRVGDAKFSNKPMYGFKLLMNTIKYRFAD